MKNKKNKIIALVCLFSICASFTVFANDSNSLFTKNIKNDNGSLSEKMALKLIDDIENINSDSKTKYLSKLSKASNDIKLSNKFNKKELSNNNVWKHKRWILENDEVKVETDEDGNPITYIKKNEQTKFLSKNKSDLSQVDNKSDIVWADSKLLEKANLLADKIEKDKKIYDGMYVSDDGIVSFKWKRIHNGYKYDLDFILVSLDKTNGEIVSISKRFISTEPIINIKINKDKALELAKNQISLVSNTKVLSVISNESVIVNPNNFCTVKNEKDTENIEQEFNRYTRLAYSITFKCKKTFANGQSIENEQTVWIDAETGKSLGGYETH